MSSTDYANYSPGIGTRSFNLISSQEKWVFASIEWEVCLPLIHMTAVGITPQSGRPLDLQSKAIATIAHAQYWHWNMIRWNFLALVLSKGKESVQLMLLFDMFTDGFLGISSRELSVAQTNS